LKISSVDSNSQTTTYRKNENKNNVTFKSLGMTILGASGALMQGIENKGYLVSFLIQDGLGMTFPRVATGFMRDKEETGEYNIKEGLEVLGREGMTGPFMISVAPFMLWLFGKFCHSAGTNTKLIKIVGQNLKSMVENPTFASKIKQSPEEFRKEFYRCNIEKFYKDTVPNDKNPDKTINYILEELENFNSDNKKVKSDAYKNILNTLNEKILSSSSDLDEICRLSINTNGKKETFSAGDVIKAITNFANDAIKNNPNASNIDAKTAENIKNNLAAKRLAFNISGIAGTLGGLSVLPKIYARNSVAPGAQRLVAQKEKEKESKNNNNVDSTSFKSKGINNNGIMAKIGAFLTKHMPEWAQKEFEYTGYNFTPSMMACLSLFGLLLPRGLRAYNRAYIDENGNRDWSEIHEILLRDTISSLAVVYTVPILTKLLVNSYENRQGFILTNKASMHKTGWQKFLDVINPYSDLKVLTNTELESLYGNIDNKIKMINFVKYINDKGGDLEKIFSKSTANNTVFNDKTFTLESLRKMDKKQKNEKIINLFNGMQNNKRTDEIIKNLMTDNIAKKQSTITKVARGLNSIPGFIVTVIISPIILGCFIPMLTYANTRKAHAKMMAKDDNSQKSTLA